MGNPPLHRARKRFGQNFLQDENVLQELVAAINPQPDDLLVEIGPGKGALTFPLLEKLKQLVVIELDRDLIAALKNHSERLQIINIDALRFDFSTLAKGPHTLRVTGNLPYNISTPLIFHCLEQAEYIRDMHFLLQKEVVDRLSATPGSKVYGRLSVMAQYYCSVEKLFEVGREAFKPAPKVTSAFVRIIPYDQLPYPADDLRRFNQLVQQAFSQRRKTLRRSLNSLCDSATFEAAGIDSGLRPEQLSVADFVKLSNSNSPVPSPDPDIRDT